MKQPILNKINVIFTKIIIYETNKIYRMFVFFLMHFLITIYKDKKMCIIFIYIHLLLLSFEIKNVSISG